MADPPRAHRRTDESGTSCPVCEAPAQRGQLVCLECGSRITLGYRRPPSWKLPVALTALVLVLTGAGGALAYQAIEGDAKREVGRTPANPKKVTPDSTEKRDEKVSDDRDPAEARDPSTEKKGTTEKDAEVKLGANDPASPEKKPAEKSTVAEGGLTRSGDLYEWPRSLRAFTVVLLSAEDRASAMRFARSAGGSGQDKVGVIRSADFETLPRGFFVVFAGEYPSRATADRAARRLGGRFRGAFAQLVRR